MTTTDIEEPLTTDSQLTTQRVQDAADELSMNHLVDDDAARFPHDRWNHLAGTGLFNDLISGDGSVDQRFARMLPALEELGFGCRDAGLSFSAATHLASTLLPVARFCSSPLRERLLPDLVAGRLIGAHAISEPEAGSDALAMTTSASRQGDRWTLSGHKAYVSNGSIADHVVVYAATGASDGPDRLSAFLVPTATDGVHVRANIPKMGLRTSPLNEIVLDGVSVPDENLLGRAGSGFFVLSYVMAHEILAVAAINVGEMRRRVDECCERARTRRQFGRPVGSFQAVSHPIVDMQLQVDTSRLWLERTAARLSRGEDTLYDVAAIKIIVSEANVTTARTAVQVFGGEGYLTGTGIERGVRDALAGTIYSGTSEIQRNRLATLLGLTPHS